MREAMFYDPLPQQRVRCRLCPHACSIADGRKGICGVRVNLGGKLYPITYGRVIVRGLDPIEKKPLFHFLPGSAAYSFASVGCNMRCTFCQNWEISQWGREGRIHRSLPRPTNVPMASRDVPGDSVSAAQLVDEAESLGAASIAYTYTEPTVFYELAYDTALLARRRGLKNIFVTCGFTSLKPIRQIAPLLDAVNVDLKFFSDSDYRRFSGARLRPILDAIQLYRELGVWIEVTTLLIPGLNDFDAELKQIARFIRRLGRDTPWHISRFRPAFRMLDTPITPLPALHRARQIGMEEGLRYVYEGNVAGEGSEDTNCPACGKTIITRRGFGVLANTLRFGKCPKCGTCIEGVWRV